MNAGARFGLRLIGISAAWQLVYFGWFVLTSWVLWLGTP